MIRPGAFSILLAGLGASASAQWGIRATILHYEPIVKPRAWALVAAVDHDVSERGSISLEYLSGLSLFGDPEDGTSTDYNGYTVQYSVRQRVSGLNLRSAFHFTENDDGSLYFGPCIGYRSVSVEVDPYAYDEYGNTPSWARRQDGVTTLITAGFRLGLRGALDGLHGDLYIGYSTSFGEVKVLNAPYLEERVQPARSFFHVGYSIGIGWE